MTQQQLEVESPHPLRFRRHGWLVLLLLAGCSSLPNGSAPEKEKEKEPAAQGPTIPGPSKYHFRESQFVFYSDFPLKQNLPIFQELGELREQIRTELQLPESNSIIQVFLFEDQAKYEAFMRARYKELPLRRAFFVKEPRNTGVAPDLFVFTWWGKDIRRDLRHELTHGILHSVSKEVPMWLDEGLAEIYELPPENNGVNSEHVELIRKGPFQPDMARLEKLSEVKQMQRPEYREAWAWAHFMLRGSSESKAILLNYLQQLRKHDKPPLLLPNLEDAHAAPGEALAEHLRHLEASKVIRASNEQR